MSTMEAELPGTATAAHDQHAVLATVLGVVRGALADRALVWAALGAAIAFTAWGLARPDPWRLLAVGGYAVLIFWPVLALTTLSKRR